jgi:hypothetical protein
MSRPAPSFGGLENLPTAQLLRITLDRDTLTKKPFEEIEK